MDDNATGLRGGGEATHNTNVGQAIAILHYLFSIICGREANTKSNTKTISWPGSGFSTLYDLANANRKDYTLKMNAALPSLSPLIKWSGGKRSELPILRPAFPQGITRVIEPFAGGAAVSLDLNPGRAVLGDVSTDLVDFYQVLGEEQVREKMILKILDIQKIREAVASWVGSLSDEQVGEISRRAIDAKRTRKAQSGKTGKKKSTREEKGEGQADKAAQGPWRVLPEALVRSWVGHVDCGDLPSSKAMALWFMHDIEASLMDKMSRIENLGNKRDQGAFSGSELRPHLLTAIHAGVYTSLRRVYNHQDLGLGPGAGQTTHQRTIPSSTGARAWKVACWYVVRNLCYAGMFRFGPNGRFNVPYGGVSYNSRDFSRVRQTLLDKDVLEFFGNAEVHLLDFDKLMDKYENFGGPASGDFIFLDPPYDSAFSQYNSEGDFTQEDQRRLSDRMRQVSTPWMLVIKNTEFILSLYEDRPGQAKLHRAVFDKSYQVNIRNRNDAQVEHLVVTNYPIPHPATVEGGGGLKLLP